MATASTLAVALAAGGCGGGSVPSVELSETWPARVGNYRDVTRKWTRHGRVRSSFGGDRGHISEQTLDVFATLKSPEWRAAYVRYRADLHDLPPSAVAALTRTQKADAADHYEVQLLVATHDRRANDLQKGKRSIWRVALADDAGAEIVASEIQRDRRPRSEIEADFPNLGDFHQPYIARFPRTVDLFGPRTRRIRLKLTSSQGGVQLIWIDRNARAERD